MTVWENTAGSGLVIGSGFGAVLGAGLYVFDPEPKPNLDPILALPVVIGIAGFIWPASTFIATAIGLREARLMAFPRLQTSSSHQRS